MTPARSRVARLLAAGALGAGVTVATDRVLTGLGAGRVPGWSKENFRGRPVTLTGGAAAAIGATVASSIFATVGRPPVGWPPVGWPPLGRPPVGWKAVAIAGVCAALAGGYDDLVAPRWERTSDKGWHGHVQALRAGRPSGGVVKVATIGAGAFAAGRLAGASWPGAVRMGALMAGTANLVNLFDLRPGRAGKVITVLAASQLRGPSGPLAAATAGAALAELPRDLGETRMLGDIGANTLGALVGLRLAANGPGRQWIALGAVAALTVASERVSFTRVIARYAPLRALDEWGRRAGGPAVATERP